MSPDEQPVRPPAPRMSLRRAIFAGLVLLSMAVLAAWFLRLAGANGLTWPEVAMLALYVVTLPWIVIGFWNAVIGLVILFVDDDPLPRVTPLAAPEPDAPITERTAIVMPVFNENPERVFRHLQAVIDTLEATGQAKAFEIFLLSDTTDAAIAAEERARFALWRSRHARPHALHYRRRPSNIGHKVGNLVAFCDAHGDRFKHMLVLDADSVMSGEAIVRLVRLMQANPQLGLLQTLAVGLPALSPFARVFQFGMRQAMRPFTVGSTWWQGDSGPYWGHNALIRLAPYRTHCRLPVLPGHPPFGGAILSHDQVEAALMRASGYEVRVLPIEGGSFEENPPTLPDFIQRELRWCQGNLQYAKLIGAPGLRPLGRLQLLLAMAMYLNPVAWMLFLVIGVGSATAIGSGLVTSPVVPAPSDGFYAGVSTTEGIALFLLMTVLTFSPKIIGVIDILIRSERRKAFGGGARIALSGILDAVFSALVAPVIALAITLFVIGLFFGRKLDWQPQTRDGHTIRAVEALRIMAPQSAFGLLILTCLSLAAPQVLPWSAPVIAGLLLAAPVTALSSRLRLGRPLVRLGLFAAPEEFATPPELHLVALDLHPRSRHPRLSALVKQPLLVAATADGERGPPG